MSNIRYSPSNTSILKICYRILTFIFFFFLFHLLIGINFLFADGLISNNYQISFENNLLSLSAKKADLKNILNDISKIRDISIRFPPSLDKKITLKIKEISIREGLERLLKDFNYSIIYSGPKKQAAISDVFVFKQNKKSAQLSAKDNRIANRIKSYEKRIESLKNNLSKVDENSTRGRSYLNRIRSYEKNIERLRAQLE